MTDMPVDFAKDSSADPGPRINGVIDVPRSNRVAGWAIDRSDSDATVTVTILSAGRKIGEVRADAHRPDLERGGVGTGRYGFSFELDPPVEPGLEFTITAVARADDGAAGELRPIGKARASEDPARRLAERTLSELFGLRAALRSLGERQDHAGELRLSEATDRIEIVQARIEQTLADRDAPRLDGPGRGLFVAVGLALAFSLGSLAIGIWSMLV